MSQAFAATVRLTRHNILFLLSPSYRRVRRRLASIEALTLARH